ncbi:hypothetical protein D3C76_1458210 [compost metagenome]
METSTTATKMSKLIIFQRLWPVWVEMARVRGPAGKGARLWPCTTSPSARGSSGSSRGDGLGMAPGEDSGMARETTRSGRTGATSL